MKKERAKMGKDYEIVCCEGCGRDTKKTNRLCFYCDTAYSHSKLGRMKGEKSRSINLQSAEGLEIGGFEEEEVKKQGYCSQKAKKGSFYNKKENKK